MAGETTLKISVNATQNYSKNNNGVNQVEFSAKELLSQKNIAMNPRTADETESRWTAIKQMRKEVQSQKLADADISLTNTAGGDHV